MFIFDMSYLCPLRMLTHKVIRVDMRETMLQVPKLRSGLVVVVTELLELRLTVLV